MSWFDQIIPVPFRLLEELQDRLDMARQGRIFQQTLKGATRPRPQRRVLNSTMAQYRRPEPVGRFGRSADLSVFWIFYGESGRMWIMRGSGAGGWFEIGRYFEPYQVDDGVPTWSRTDYVDHFLANRDNYLANLAGWTPRPKYWVPEYGLAGDYGDWYDYRRLPNLAFAIKETGQVNSGYEFNRPAELHVSFVEIGGSVQDNRVDYRWCSVGESATACLRYTYQYYSGAFYSYSRITEQKPEDVVPMTRPYDWVRYWAYQINVSTGADSANDAYSHALTKTGFNTKEQSLDVLGVQLSASASIDPTVHQIGLDSLVHTPRPDAESSPSCPNVTWGGGSCPFDVEPPLFTWGDYGWPDRKFDNVTLGNVYYPATDTLKQTYQIINPFLLGAFQDYVVEGSSWAETDALTEANMRAESKLIGGGPYEFAATTAIARDPEYDLARDFDLFAGFNRDSFQEWVSSQINFNNIQPFPVAFSTPAHLNYLSSKTQASADPVPMLPVPEWTWAPDTTRGGFAADLTETESIAEAARLLMQSGVLYFVRSDGVREGVRVGGASVEFPEDGSYVEMLVATNWDNPKQTATLARRHGLI